MKTRDDDNEELEIRDLNAREVLYAESKVTRCHETVARVYDLGAGTPGGQAILPRSGDLYPTALT